jgi:hypothetical protein
VYILDAVRKVYVVRLLWQNSRKDVWKTREALHMCLRKQFPFELAKFPNVCSPPPTPRSIGNDWLVEPCVVCVCACVRVCVGLLFIRELSLRLFPFWFSPAKFTRWGSNLFSTTFTSAEHRPRVTADGCPCWSQNMYIRLILKGKSLEFNLPLNRPRRPRSGANIWLFL